MQSQNEELGWEKIWNPWGGTEGKAESYALCNEINQKFVDIVRSSGGNNAERHLLISGYNTGIDRTCDDLFKMPSDPANRMAVSVHYYSPAGFAILEEAADWGKAAPTWGSDEDYASLRSEMNMMKTHFTDKGIPVIIGEYGCPTTNKEPESVRRFLCLRSIHDEASAFNEYGSEIREWFNNPRIPIEFSKWCNGVHRLFRTSLYHFLPERGEPIPYVL